MHHMKEPTTKNPLALHWLISKQNCHVIQVRWLSGVPRRPVHPMTCNCSHTPFSSVKINLCLSPVAWLCGSSPSLLFRSCSRLVMLPFCWVFAPLWPRHTLVKTNTSKNSNTDPSKSRACKYRVLSAAVSKSKQMWRLLAFQSVSFWTTHTALWKYIYFTTSYFSHLPTYCSKKFYSHTQAPSSVQNNLHFLTTSTIDNFHNPSLQCKLMYSWQLQ